jgi:chromosome segregation ATPase
MESFNTGVRLPPVMANITRRVEELESHVKETDRDISTESTNVQSKQDSVDKHDSQRPIEVESLIETVEEPMIKDCPHREKIERSIRELEGKITKVNGIIEDKNKEISKLNSSIIQLNSALEEAIKRIHSLEKQMQEKSVESSVKIEEHPKTSDTTDFVTKKELKDTENRIVKELTDKIDAELIDAEERFDEKLKASTEAIKLALDETIGGDEEEDDEEEDIEGVIDME